MKKSFLLVILFLIPFVCADMYLDSILKTQYNLGDDVILSGYMIEDKDVEGILNLFLECENESIQLAAKFTRIEQDLSESFDHNFLINTDTIGDCNFKLQLKDLEGNLVDETTSDGFKVTKELNSVFNINENQYVNNFQLGDDITLSGTILNLNDINVNGLATIYIKKDGINYLSDSAIINNGNFEYVTTLIQMPAGNYSLDFDVKDVKGNEEFYSNALRFNLEDDLIINAIPNKNSYMPGDIISLTGTVQKKIGGYITENKIEIELDGEKYTTDIELGEFSFNIPSSTAIKSFEHNITLSASDEYGNYGEQSIIISVIPIPTSFNVELDKVSYVPEDEVIIQPYLFDQAGDRISKRVDLRIKNVKKEVVYEETALTTDEFIYKLPQFAVPGEWKLEAESAELEDEIIIKVDPIQLIDVSLTGEVLAVKNLGNKLFEDEIAIDGNGIIKTKKVKLKPNQTAYIPLFKLFKAGTYTFSVLGEEFVDVTIIEKGIIDSISGGIKSITGMASGAGENLTLTGVLSLLAVIFCVIFVFYLAYKSGFSYYIGRKPDHERRKYDRLEGAKKLAELKSKKKKYNFDFGKSTEKDVQEFRNRMVESFKKPEEPKKEKTGFIFPRKKQEPSEEPKPQPTPEEPQPEPQPEKKLLEPPKPGDPPIPEDKSKNPPKGTFSMFD